MDTKKGSKWKLLVWCPFKEAPVEHAKLKDPVRLEQNFQYFK